MAERKTFFNKMEDLQVVRAIRRGLIMTIPLLMIGSFALIFNILPIPAYQVFLAGEVGRHLSDFFVTVNEVTFGVLGLCSCISVSASYARIRMSQTAVVMGASFSALCAYAVFIGLFTDHFDIASLGAQGMFTALFSALAGSALYCKLVESGRFSFRLYTVGADIDFNNIVSVILPVGIVVFAAYLLNVLITTLLPVTGFEGLFHEATIAFFNLFENTSIKALLFVIFTNLLWFFGIHGTNVLEGVAQNIFHGDTGGTALAGFLNKPVIDVFVFMGGCGATISLLVAMLLFGKKKNNRNLAKMATLPMLFNINELMVFGLPIVFNASFFIPFLLVPLVNVGITAVALTAGFIPQPARVDWVMPIFVNGYLSTGSVAGVVLQAFNILVGALIYRAFLFRDERRTDMRIKGNLRELVKVMQSAEEKGQALVLLELKGGIGGLTKMLASDLTHSLNKPDAWQMFYQPQYNDKDVCVGAEALLRWNHPLCGMIYPPLAVGLAGETGLLCELERTVFKKVCADISVMQAAGVCPASISVNATAATLQDVDFLDFVKQLLEGNPSLRDVLCIELTEQMSFNMSASVEERLRKIHDLGIRFEVDDFSMGHTSVKYLQSGLFDVVKLDGSLVSNMKDNERSVEIIWSIIQMAETMGFSVMAEYVETVEQRDMLREMGCRLYQGYLFSPAIPLPAFIKRIQTETGVPVPVAQDTAELP